MNIQKADIKSEKIENAILKKLDEPEQQEYAQELIKKYAEGFVDCAKLHKKKGGPPNA